MSGKIERNEWLIAIVAVLGFQAILFAAFSFFRTSFSPWDVVAALSQSANMTDIFAGRTYSSTGMQWQGFITLLLFYLVGPILLFQATAKRLRGESGRLSLIIGIVLTVGTIPYNVMSVAGLSYQMHMTDANVDPDAERLKLGNLGFDALALMADGTSPSDITLESLPSYDGTPDTYLLGLTDDGKLMISSSSIPESRLVLTPPTAMEWK